MKTLFTILLFSAAPACLFAQVNCGNIDFVPFTACSGEMTSFSSTWSGSDQIATYNWDLGTGTVYNDPVPQVIINDSGNYKVKLVVVSDSGCVDSVERTIRINLKPAGYSIVGSPVIIEGVEKKFVFALGNWGDKLGFTWTTCSGCGIFSDIHNDTVVFTPGPGIVSTKVCVELFPVAGCPSQEYCINVTVQVGMEERVEISPAVFPNPSPGSFSVLLADPHSYTYKLSGINGIEIPCHLEYRVDGLDIGLPPGIPPGVYFLEGAGKGGGHIFHVKIVKAN